MVAFAAGHIRLFYGLQSVGMVLLVPIVLLASQQSPLHRLFETPPSSRPDASDSNQTTTNPSALQTQP